MQEICIQSAEKLPQVQLFVQLVQMKIAYPALLLQCSENLHSCVNEL